MSVSGADTNATKDWVRQPASLIFWWLLPTLLGVVASMLSLSFAATAFVWTGAFVWMGAGCVLNARRCSRSHCYFSGPALWLGAVAAGLVGSGIIFNPRALSYILWGTAALVALSYIPEIIWGRYARNG